MSYLPTHEPDAITYPSLHAVMNRKALCSYIPKKHCTFFQQMKTQNEKYRQMARERERERENERNKQRQKDRHRDRERERDRERVRNRDR